MSSEIQQNYQREYRHKNREKIFLSKKLYRERNKERLKIKKHKDYLANKIRLRFQHREYYFAHKKEAQEYFKRYQKNHKQKLIQLRREWVAKNRKYVSEWQRRYRQLNVEAIAKYMEVYQQLHKVELAEKRRMYWKHHKHLKRVHHHTRILRLKEAGALTVETIQKVYEDNIKQYGTLTCYLCESPIVFGEDNLEHRTPLSRNGTNVYENLKVSCSLCNIRKRNKTESEYRLWLSKKGKNYA